jgi:hypothetical protein
LWRITFVVDALREAPATIRKLRLQANEYQILEREPHNLQDQYELVSRISQILPQLNEIIIDRCFVWIGERARRISPADDPSSTVSWSPRCINKNALDWAMINPRSPAVVDYNSYLYRLHAREIASGMVKKPRTTSEPLLPGPGA